MKAMIILKMVGILYRKVGLRTLIIGFINDPENEWDEALIMALDEFFGYVATVTPGD